MKKTAFALLAGLLSASAFACDMDAHFDPSWEGRLVKVDRQELAWAVLPAWKDLVAKALGKTGVSEREQAEAIREGDAFLGWQKDARQFVECHQPKLQAKADELRELEKFLDYLNSLTKRSMDEVVGLVVESPVNHPSMAWTCRLREGLDGTVSRTAVRDFNKCANDFSERHFSYYRSQRRELRDAVAAVSERVFATQ